MKQWLRELFDQYLANVSELTPHDRSKAEAWANWIKAKWAEQGFHSPSKQQPLLVEVRQALQDYLGDQHIALTTLKLDEATANDSQSKEAIATVSSNNGKSPTSRSTTSKKAGDTRNGSSPGMLTAREAYTLACDRGYSGSKQQMQKLARQSPVEFQEEYGLAYSKTVSFGRNAKNWIDRWGGYDSDAPSPATSPSADIPASADRSTLSNQDLQEATRQISQTILWFIRQIEDLRTQCDAFENSVATEVSVESSDVYAGLKQENTSLRAERDNLHNTLDRIQTTFTTPAQSPPKPSSKSPSKPTSKPKSSSSKTTPKSPSKSTAKATSRATTKATTKASASAPTQKKRNQKASSSKTKKATGATKTTKSTEATKPTKATQSAKSTKTSKATKASKATKTTQTKAKGRPAKSADLDQTVVQALNAIMDYNNASGRSHDEKWVISYPTMKDLLKQVGSSTQPKIREVFDAYKTDIDRHHDKHNLSSRHNRVHGQQTISDMIQLGS